MDLSQNHPGDRKTPKACRGFGQKLSSESDVPSEFMMQVRGEWGRPESIYHPDDLGAFIRPTPHKVSNGHHQGPIHAKNPEGL